MKAKSENKKAMPKFIIIMAASLLFGALLGVGIVFAEGDWTATLGEALMHTLAKASPWILIGLAIVSAALQFGLYRSAKKQYSAGTKRTKTSWKRSTAP